MLQKLRDLQTLISLALVEVFQARVREGRNPDLIHLLKYLKNPDFFDENQDQFGIKLRKTKITALATSLLQRLFHQRSTEETEVVVEVSHDLEKNQPKTLSEESTSFIEERHQTTKVQDEVESCIVKKQMSLFEATTKIPENLQKLFNAPLTIKPTSVEPERVFSSMGLFATKVRSQLCDETLDALIVMHQKFKK